MSRNHSGESGSTGTVTARQCQCNVCQCKWQLSRNFNLNNPDSELEASPIMLLPYY